MLSRHIRAFAIVAAAALALSVSTAASASTVAVTILMRGDGDTLRAVFYDGQNGTGDALYYYDSTACTPTKSTAELLVGDLRRLGWDDRIESVKDFNSCDVNVYRDISFGGGSTGYVNYGSAGKNLTSAFRNLPSSFRVS